MSGCVIGTYRDPRGREPLLVQWNPYWWKPSDLRNVSESPDAWTFVHILTGLTVDDER